MTLLSDLDEYGFVIVPHVVDVATVAGLRDAVSSIQNADGIRARNEQVYAVRNLLSEPAVRNLADADAVRAIIASVIGSGATAVRAILFDKTPDANWKVAWHQDLSITVRERIDVPGFGPWSAKAGVVHVQPPTMFLERMVTLRLHLDDCYENNGPLRVMPGSHRHGALSPPDVEMWRTRTTAVTCLVPAGGAVLMRPLILHASSSAATPGQRRVVHIEWSADRLPGGLLWNES